MSPLSWFCPPHACHNNATIIGDVGRPLWKSAWPSLRRLPKALVQLELLWENASHKITKWICDGSERNIIGTELVLHLYRNSPLISKRCTTTNDAHLNGGWSPPLVSTVSHFWIQKAIESLTGSNISIESSNSRFLHPLVHDAHAIVEQNQQPRNQDHPHFESLWDLWAKPESDSKHAEKCVAGRAYNA